MHIERRYTTQQTPFQKVELPHSIPSPKAVQDRGLRGHLVGRNNIRLLSDIWRCVLLCGIHVLFLYKNLWLGVSRLMPSTWWTNADTQYEYWHTYGICWTFKVHISTSGFQTTSTLCWSPKLHPHRHEPQDERTFGMSCSSVSVFSNTPFICLKNAYPGLGWPKQ